MDPSIRGRSEPRLPPVVVATPAYGHDSSAALASAVSEMGRDEQWAWASSTFPALKHLDADSGVSIAFDRFARWFRPDRTYTVYWRNVGDSECTAVKGRLAGGTFVGKSGITVSIEDDTKRVSYSQVEIGANSIIETGPHGIEYERGKDGRWHEAAGWATGCFETITADGMSSATARQVEFATYSFSATVSCAGRDEWTQQCIGGGERTCSRCQGLDIERHAYRRGFGHGSIGIGHRAGPVDCSQPCPPDLWTDKIEALNEALAGRTFFDRGGPQVILYRRPGDCRAAARAEKTP